MDMVLLLISIVLLLVLSGFFSGSETALTAASKSRMRSLAQDNDSRAKVVEKLLETKDRLIGALLLGNNLVNILASALTTKMLLGIFGDAGVVYATILMTVMVLIFSEVLPKTLALHKADDVALTIAPIIRVLVRLFSPITRMISAIVTFILKDIFRIDITATAMGAHIDELRGAIELYENPDMPNRDERAMLHSILDLAEVDVSEIMTHRNGLEMIDAEAPIDELVDQVLTSPYTRLPVWQGSQENIIGVVHAKNLLRALKDCKYKIKSLKLEDVMQEPWFIPDTTSLIDQLEAFQAKKEHFALVVDEYGGLEGLVTLEDIIEEIVGEIDDEHDIPVPGLHPQPNGSILANGDVTIRDINREFNLRLPTDDYVTVAGLLLHESKTIPQKGQVFHFHACRFEVLQRTGNRITRIKITPQDSNE